MHSGPIALVALTLVALAGCASGGPAPTTGRSASMQPVVYRLGAGDKVRVIVFNDKELSGEFFVSSAGTIDLPLVGSIKAAGETASEVQAGIEASLKTGYIKQPHVSVEVLTYRPFYILGEVEKPGEYPYTNGLTVPKAVATAGGFTYRADERRVLIKPADKASEELLPLTTDALVAPGDTIRVRERYF